MIWLTILKNRKILLYIGLLVMAGLSLWWLRNSGYRACEIDYKTKQMIAVHDAQVEKRKIEEDYRKLRDSLGEDSGYGVGSNTARALDILRQRSGG